MVRAVSSNISNDYTRSVGSSTTNMLSDNNLSKIQSQLLEIKSTIQLLRDHGLDKLSSSDISKFNKLSDKFLSSKNMSGPDSKWVSEFRDTINKISNDITSAHTETFIEIVDVVNLYKSVTSDKRLLDDVKRKVINDLNKVLKDFSKDHKLSTNDLGKLTQRLSSIGNSNSGSTISSKQFKDTNLLGSNNPNILSNMSNRYNGTPSNAIYGIHQNILSGAFSSLGLSQVDRSLGLSQHATNKIFNAYGSANNILSTPRSSNNIEKSLEAIANRISNSSDKDNKILFALTKLLGTPKTGGASSNVSTYEMFKNISTTTSNDNNKRSSTRNTSNNDNSHSDGLLDYFKGKYGSKLLSKIPGLSSLGKYGVAGAAAIGGDWDTALDAMSNSASKAVAPSIASSGGWLSGIGSFAKGALKTGANFIGKAAGPISGVIDGALEYSNGSSLGRSITSGLASGVGAIAGGALGSLAGPVGTIAGGVGGSIASKNIALNYYDKVFGKSNKKTTTSSSVSTTHTMSSSEMDSKIMERVQDASDASALVAVFKTLTDGIKQSILAYPTDGMIINYLRNLLLQKKGNQSGSSSTGRVVSPDGSTPSATSGGQSTPNTGDNASSRSGPESRTGAPGTGGGSSRPGGGSDSTPSTVEDPNTKLKAEMDKAVAAGDNKKAAEIGNQMIANNRKAAADASGGDKVVPGDPSKINWSKGTKTYSAENYQRASIVMNDAMSAGADKNAAAALAGNAHTESQGFKTNAENNKGERSFSMFQFNGARQDAFRKWASDNGKDPNDHKNQVDYALNHEDPRVSGVSKKEMDWFKSGKGTAQEKSDWWLKHWERARDREAGGQNSKDRGSQANNYLDHYNKLEDRNKKTDTGPVPDDLSKITGGGGSSGGGGASGSFGDDTKSSESSSSATDIIKKYEGKAFPNAKGNTECAALAQQQAGVGHTSTWKQGANAISDGNLKPGTPIATFGGDGKYKNTSGQSHTAIFLGYEKDRNGKITGMKVLEQYNGSGRAQQRTYKVGDSRGGEKDAANYHVISNKEGSSTPQGMMSAKGPITDKDKIQEVQSGKSAPSEVASSKSDVPSTSSKLESKGYATNDLVDKVSGKSTSMSVSTSSSTIDEFNSSSDRLATDKEKSLANSSASDFANSKSYSIGDVNGPYQPDNSIKSASTSLVPTETPSSKTPDATKTLPVSTPPTKSEPDSSSSSSSKSDTSSSSTPSNSIAYASNQDVSKDNTDRSTRMDDYGLAIFKHAILES